MNYFSKKYFLLFLFYFISIFSYGWGFYGHKLICKYAVFTLPPEMIPIYKNHISYLIDHSGDPDKRSHVMEGEAPKHYINIELYGDSALFKIPHYWKDAVAKYTEDTLMKYGINPWWVSKMSFQLTQAFKEMNFERILYISANIAHYIGDATVPLHSTKFYDGKSALQKGIHSFWESRIPELLAENYNYIVGKAIYIDNIQEYTWNLVTESHIQVDTIFAIEENLRVKFPEDKKYGIVKKGRKISKQFSEEYCKEFDKLSKEMVKRNLLKAIKAVGSIWYTCWVNAGQPDLKLLEDKTFLKKQKQEAKEIEKMWKTGKVNPKVIQE